MENKPQPIEDLRRSARHNANYIPLNLISNDVYYDIPARLNNVSLGGFQILCSHMRHSNYQNQSILRMAKAWKQ